MTPDDLNLPFEYSTHSRAGGRALIALTVGITLCLIAAHVFAGLAWTIVSVPSILLFFRAYFFSLIRNATHEAMRMASLDAQLDGIVREQTKKIVEHKATRTFTPARMAEAMEGSAH